MSEAHASEEPVREQRCSGSHTQRIQDAAGAGAAPLVRCPWATKEPEISYHDTEWGVPEHDDRMLFELMTLEGAQAGLSWDTILRKRAGYREAFENFDPAVVARFDSGRVDALVRDTRIVRHRGKITATVANAAAFLRVQAEFGSFDAYLWNFVDGKPIVTHRPQNAELPARTDLSDRVSKDLRARGFAFVGSTIVYAFLQAAGLVDDHRTTCFRAQPVAARDRTSRNGSALPKRDHERPGRRPKAH